MKSQIRYNELKPPRIFKKKLSRVVSYMVSKVLIDLNSRNNVLSGVDVWKGVNAVVDNDGEMEEIVDDVESEAVIENFDDGVSSGNTPEWMTGANTITHNLFPILSRLGSTISDVELSCIFSEVVNFTKDLGKDMVLGTEMEGKDSF